MASRELVINAREPGLGVGRLVSSDGDRRVYRFANGGERSFTEAYCRLYMKPAPPNVQPVSAEPTVAVARARKPQPPLPRGKPPPPKASNAAFEAQIRAQPDDAGGYIVYADWLLDEGDPRGELITIQAQRAAAPDDAALAAAEAKLVKKHAAYFVPEALSRALKLPRSRGPRCEVTWRNGFFAHVRLARDSTPSHKAINLDVVARAVLAHPSARFLRSLALGPLGMNAYSYTPIVAVVAKGHHLVLAELVLGDLEGDTRGTHAAGVAGVLVAAPALERLVVAVGEVTFGGALAHASLRELSITATALVDLDVLAAARLPALESLVVRTDALELEPAHVARMRGSFPALRTLVLTGTRGTSALVTRLIDSPLLRQLVELDLAGSDLDDRAARRDGRARAVHAPAAPRRLGQPQAIRRLGTAPRRGDRCDHAAVDACDHRRHRDRACPGPRVGRGGARDRGRREVAALGYDRRRTGRVWGEYEGRDHYYVYAYLRERTVGCSCGSAKNPCKHALALLLLAAHKHPYREAPIPDAAARNASPWRPVYPDRLTWHWQATGYGLRASASAMRSTSGRSPKPEARSPINPSPTPRRRRP